MKIRVLVSLVLQALQDASALPTVSLQFAEAPNALVYEMCDLKALDEAWLDAGDWEAGLHPAVRLNDSFDFGPFLPWSRFDHFRSDLPCMNMSHDPSRFDTGIANIQVYICDGNRNCIFPISSAEAMVRIEQNPFQIHFIDQEVNEASSAIITADEYKDSGICSAHRRLWQLSNSKKRYFLQGTSLCEVALTYPEQPRYSCLEIPSTVKSRDTLIIYSFSHSDLWRGDNFFFWLAQGLVLHGRYQFVVVVGGHLDAGWRDILDRIAAHSPSFEWVQLPLARCDVCAWRSVLAGGLLQDGPQRFSRFVLLSAACRGPFLPSYYPGPWPEAFFSLLTGEAGLAGSAASCSCDRARSVHGEPVEGGTCAHLEGCVLAFRADMLARVRAELAEAQCDRCVGGDGGDIRQLVWRLTRAAPAEGWAVVAVEGDWAGVNLRDPAATARICAGASAADDSEPDHPLDVVFVDEAARNSGQDTLHRFTRMALGNVPWAVPMSVFCQAAMDLRT